MKVAKKVVSRLALDFEGNIPSSYLNMEVGENFPKSVITTHVNNMIASEVDSMLTDGKYRSDEELATPLHRYISEKVDLYLAFLKY